MAFALKDRLARQAAGEAQLSFDPTGRDEPQLVSLSLDRLDPDRDQPRRDLGNLTELAMSIQEHGLLQPLIVEAVGGGRYRILAGERRFAACRSLGQETAPCIVRTVAEHSRLALQLIENLHRKDLHPVEEARAIKRLANEFNLSQRELAQRLGKSLSSINQELRILDLDKDILAAVQTSEHATKSLLLEIAKEPDPKQQRLLWDKAQAGQLTVRRAKAQKRAGPAVHPRNAQCTIPLAGATVVIRFQQGEGTRERVADVLRQALAAHLAQY